MGWDFNLEDLFDDVDDALLRIRNRINQFNWNYETHWLFGWVVHNVTYPVCDRLLDASNAFDRLEDRGEDIEDAFWHVLSGGYFEDRLDGFIDDFHEFVHDTGYWVVLRIRDFWDDFYWFAQDPKWMIRYWLQDYFPWLEGFFDAPRNWVMDHVAPTNTWRYWFFQDPLGYIAARLVADTSFTWDVFDHPVSWVVDRFFDRYPAWYSAFEDPAGWFYDSMRIMLGDEYGDLKERWDELRAFIDHPGQYVRDAIIEHMSYIVERWIVRFW